MTCRVCGEDMVGDGYTTVRHCANVDVIGEGYAPDEGPVHCPAHLNPASTLPPVGCPLLIEVDGDLFRAERTSFIADREDAMIYQLKDGPRIEGRFRWTYP